MSNDVNMQAVKVRLERFCFFACCLSCMMIGMYNNIPNDKSVTLAVPLYTSRLFIRYSPFAAKRKKKTN